MQDNAIMDQKNAPSAVAVQCQLICEIKRKRKEGENA
jgi:hypothetical protein